MISLRTSVAVTCVLLVGVLCMPAAALAAAPQLVSPKASAPDVTTGSSMEFEWSGVLEGDPTALTRSYFRLEVIDVKDVPAGAQDEWPSSKLENLVQTEPGASVTSATMGVPLAGQYAWRVCAWGVVDAAANNMLQQLPGGCSTSRTFTSVAATNQRGAIGELKVETRKQVGGTVRRVYVERPAAPAAADPEPAPQPRPAVEAAEPEPVTRVQQVERRDLGEHGTALALGSGSDDAFGADPAADRRGVGGSLMTGLTTSLPFLPIPFWTLAFLVICVPLARIWRRDVLAMFDWADGSVNGRGQELAGSDQLQIVANAHEFQIGSIAADGEMDAPVSHGARQGGRRAA